MRTGKWQRHRRRSITKVLLLPLSCCMPHFFLISSKGTKLKESPEFEHFNLASNKKKRLHGCLWGCHWGETFFFNFFYFLLVTLMVWLLNKNHVAKWQKAWQPQECSCPSLSSQLTISLAGGNGKHVSHVNTPPPPSPPPQLMREVMIAIIYGSWMSKSHQ